MRRVFLCASLAAALLPASAAAQSEALTEVQVLALLTPDSPRVRAIRSEVDVAQAEVLAAGRWPNPRIYFGRESTAGVAEHTATVSQLLPITGRRGLEIQAASFLAKATESRADESVRRVRAGLRTAFGDLVSAQVRERELGTARERLRELVDVLAKREAAGDAAGFDRLRAERELIDLETDLATTRADRLRAQMTLAGFLASTQSPEAILVLDSPATARPVLPEIAELIQRAETKRGDLQALLREAEAAEVSLRLADRRRLPEPEIVAGTKTSTIGNGDVGGVIAVHATVPLFDRNRSGRATAEARRKLATDQATVLRQAIRIEVTTLRATVLGARQTADEYRSRAVNAAATLERIAQLSYEAGERTILELLDAYRIGAGARVRQAQLDAAVRQAEIALEYASAWEMP